MKKIGKYFLISFAILILLLIGVLLSLRLPYVQQKITQKATSYISDKTNTQVKIDRLYITFLGAAQIDGLYLEDLKRDTLLYSEATTIDLEWEPLMNGDINIKSLQLKGVRASVYNNKQDSSFNYQFLINTFSSNNNDENLPSQKVTKEKNSNSTFSVSDITLNDIRFSYVDVFPDMETRVALQHLHTSIDSLDLNKLFFEIDEFDINGLSLNFKQAKAFAPATDTSQSILPTIIINQLTGSKISLDYNLIYDSLFLKSKLNNIQLKETLLGLNDQNISGSSAMLNADVFDLQMPQADTVNASSSKVEKSVFEWPKWKVNIGQFNFNLSNLDINQGRFKPQEAPYFDAKHLHYKDIALNSESLEYAPGLFRVQHLKSTLSSKDEAFQLKQFEVGLLLNDSTLRIENLRLKTTKSRLESYQQLNYPGIDALVNANLEKLTANINVKMGTSIDLSEAYYFSPSLRGNNTFVEAAKKKVKIYGKISGNTKKTTFDNLYLFYGKKSSFYASGKAINLLDTNQLNAHLKNFKLNASTIDLSFLIPENYASSYPQNLLLEGVLNYTPQKVSGQIEGTLDQKSKLKLDLSYRLSQPNNYKLSFQGHDLAINEWLQDSVNLRPIDIELNARGSGIELPNINSTIALKVANLQYQEYLFDTVSFSAAINKGNFEMLSDYSDENLKYQLKGNGLVSGVQQKISLKLSLEQLKLNAFQLTDSLAYLQSELSADVTIDSSSQALDLYISQLSFADESNFLKLNPLTLKVINGEKASKLDFYWEEVALKLNVNQSLSALAHFQINSQNIRDLELYKSDSIYKPIQLKLNVEAALSDNLNRLLKESIQFDSIGVNLNYDSDKKDLNMEVKIPKFRYQDITIDSLDLLAEADTSSLEFKAVVKKIESGFINIYSTKIDADINPTSAGFSIDIEDELGDNLFLLNADATTSTDSLLWRIDTEKLILNGEKWFLDRKNYFYLAKDHFVLHYMAFQKNDEKFLIETLEDQGLHGLHLNFEDFDVGNLIAVLNPEEVILSGILNGDIKLKDLNNPLNFNAKINLNDIIVLEQEAGSLALSTEQLEDKSYEISANTSGPIQLEGKGSLNLKNEFPVFDFNIMLNHIDLDFITQFTPTIVQEAEGELTGDLTIKGTSEDFKYSGELRFKEAKLFITELNTSFSLPNESIALNKQTIALNDFTILDKQAHKMFLNGRIITEDLLTPTFDLRLKADDFQLMDKVKTDNSLYYGKAFVNAEASIKGPLFSPIVKANFRINENTDFVYKVPVSSVDVIEMEEVVRFKDPFEALDSLKGKGDSTSAQAVSIYGLDLNALIKTDKKAKFKIIIDEKRGDFLEVSGESDLNLVLDKNGDVNLTGNYLVNDGFYQLSLYDLVKRKFEISPNSEVKWYGDPMDASLNLTATYNLETSPNTLMMNQQVSTRKLPFIVSLFINGTLSVPSVTFGLDMPAEAQGASGGRIYQQIQAINNNETELNKQVFSLLVLNQFFPAGSSSEGPDSEVLARNSASQILTNQLNKLSNQYIKRVDLNVDLESYKANEKGSAAQRTQLGLSLSKSLFNERFKVQIGSQFELEGEQRSKQSTSEILGNILIEYLITEDGRYKLTGYRKNEFEGLIDGQVTVTGISIKFNKDFEKFKDLLNETDNSNDEE